MADSKKDERTFEVIHGSISLKAGTKPRVVGDSIRESEIPGTKAERDASIEKWTKWELIRDTALPFTPAAMVNTITSHTLRLAQDLGLVTNEGAVYEFAGRTFKGMTELTNGVTHGEVAEEIKAAFAKKNATIAELSKRLPAQPAS